MNNRTIQYFENVTVFEEFQSVQSNLKMVSDEALFSFENVTAYPRANVWDAIDTPSFHDPDSTYLTGDEISNKVMVPFRYWCDRVADGDDGSVTIHQRLCGQEFV